MRKDEYELIVQDCGEQINSLELSDFLRNFRGSYITCYAFLMIHDFRERPDNYFVRAILDQKSEEMPESDEDFAIFFENYKNVIPMYKNVFAKNKFLPPEVELNFSRISTNSPLTFIGYCTGISLLALALAVALAGGEADLKMSKFKVNSLLDAIRKWRR